MNTNYSNNLHLQQQLQLQQQQHQNAQQGGQQPQQQPPPSMQPDQNMNQNMDQARLQQWALRYGQNAAADMNHAKSAQLAEMMKRNPNQFGRHQPQHSFAATATMGLGIQNGANVLGGNPQQSFHEQHPSNMSQQPHLSQSFPNMGVMSNGNVNAAASASLQGRNPSGVHPGSQAARPLDMMGTVQGQQPQNNSVNPNKFPQPQQPQLGSLRDSQQISFPQGPTQGSADMFPEGLRRPSPHPGAMQQAPNLGQGVQAPHPGFMGAMSGGNRPQNFDFQQRIHLLQATIRNLETQYATLQAQAANYRGNPATETQFNQKSNEIKTEIAKRKEHMARLLFVWKQLQSQPGGQHSSIAAGNGGQTSNNQWASHSNPGQQFDPNGPSRPPSIGLLPNQPTHVMQTSPNLPQVSVQTNPLLNSGLPQRNIPTPQQPPQSLPPHANSLNGMGSVSFTKPNALLPKGPQSSIGSVQGGNAMTNFISPISMLGMDKAQFDSNFKTFLTRRGGNMESHLRFLEGRPLDLHSLYFQVMQEGGLSKIEGNDNAWSVIGARLGHVQFPGSPMEPAKSGLGVAQSIQHLYKEYIAPFEAWYITMIQEYKKHSSNAALQTALSSSRYGLQQLLQMVNMPPAELQSQGVDEKTMQLLEMHKVSLQRFLQEQRVFAESVRNNAAQNAGHADQNGAMSHRPPSMGPSSPFGASGSQQPQQNLLTVANRTQLQHQMMLQQGLQSTIPNGVDAMMGTRMPGQQMSLTPQGAMGGNTMQNFAQKASMNQAQAQAAQLVEQFKNDYAMSTFPNGNLDVPIEQQVEYTQLLEQLHRQCVDMERRLPTVAFILKDVDESLLKRVVTILCAVNQQRNNMSSASGPRYIVALDPLKAMANDLARINDIFITHFQNLKMQQMQRQHQALRPQQQPQMGSNFMAPPAVKQEMPSQQGRAMMPHNRPSNEVPAQQPQQSQQSQHSSQPQPPLNPNQNHRPPASLQPPKRKPPQTPGSSGAASSPSPIPITSAPTPVANTPTPTATASSPPSTKSPKAKAKSKAAITKQRRASKVVQSVAPTVEEAKPTLPSSVAAGKRPREEDSTPSSGGSGNTAGESSEVMNEGSPPKRMKSEWESQPSEAQRKQSEMVANIKTDEDATALFDQMTELIKRAAEEEGGQPSSITTGISETLDMLLKGYGPVPDAMDRFSAASVGMGGESSSSRDLDAAPTLGDPFDEFFDFSFGTVEDEDSKTPDLVSSSSTNPSPESNNDESGHHLLPSASSSTIDVKTEDFSDPLRLGTWKEIDGGEAAYFQTTEWKYDSPMTSFEQPWAIFNS